MTHITLLKPVLLLGLLCLTGCLPLKDEPTNQQIADVINQQAENCDTAVSHDARVLCAHNQARAAADSPTPSPTLQPMQWNEDLAQVAQSYAEQCVWAHNPDRADTFNVAIGENLYATTAEPTPEAAITSWVSEVTAYDYSTNTCAAGEMCGHYTQVMWRETNEVGCGTQFCPTIQNITWPNGGYVVVCNYAPAGNYFGQRPY